MEEKNKYYFEFSIDFESNYDVTQLEKVLGLKATDLVQYEDSLGPQKSAKFVYTTKEFDEIYTDDEFFRFLKAVYPYLTPLPKIMQENSGKLSFCVVFTQIEEKPCISLNQEAIMLLAQLNASFDIDYA